MRFKHPLAVLAAAMLLSACQFDAERFTVDGNIGDPLAAAPGSKVYLLGADGWAEALDSTVVRDGKFTFKGEVDRTTLLTAVLHYPGMDPYDTRFRVQFIPDSEKIGIDLDYPAIVTGSPLTDARMHLHDGIIDLYRERESEIGELAMNGMQAQADSVYRLQMQKINDLCRSTYLQHTGDFVGLQALSILARSISGTELAELVSQGAPFIAEDPVIRDSLDSKLQ